MNMKRKNERTKEKERTKNEKMEKKGRSGRKRSYKYYKKIAQLQSEINHDMKEVFLARLVYHISLGNV